MASIRPCLFKHVLVHMEDNNVHNARENGFKFALARRSSESLIS